jgi:hypothetical protein
MRDYGSTEAEVNALGEANLNEIGFVPKLL